MLIDLIAGARPNFMKIAPIIEAIKQEQEFGRDISFRLIHTGQHYDKNMSDSFFEQLEIPVPDVNLGAGGGSQAEQTAAIMIGYEKLLLDRGKPKVCLVVGDVNSSMACSITAQKMHVEVAHVEAGIRSGDWSMPEEINRIVTDSITNHFFATSSVAVDNLKALGVSDDRVHFVGNTMIDTLLKFKKRFIRPEIFDRIGLKNGEYFVVTLHRPSNVDDGCKLVELLDEIMNHTRSMPVVFPMHPRTAKNMQRIGISHPRLHIIQPLGYLEFNYLVQRSIAVITDSGGITEETTVLGVPCMTLRNSTERPETVSIGTNELLGVDPRAIAPAMKRLFSGEWKKGTIPPLWDGKTSERIVATLMNLYN